MKNGHKIILLIFAALILAILTSCESVTATQPDSEDTSENISCEFVSISNGANITNEDSLQVLVYLCAGAEYINNAESCYIDNYQVIDSLLVTDSEFEAITSLNLNLNDSLIMINGITQIRIENNMIINYKTKN